MVLVYSTPLAVPGSRTAPAGKSLPPFQMTPFKLMMTPFKFAVFAGTRVRGRIPVIDLVPCAAVICGDAQGCQDVTRCGHSHRRQRVHSCWCAERTISRLPVVHSIH